MVVIMEVRNPQQIQNTMFASAVNKFFIPEAITLNCSSFENASKFSVPILLFSKLPSPRLHFSLQFPRRGFILSRSSSEAGNVSSRENTEWLKKLPDKKKPLYSHSLPCTEAWLKQLGFFQSKEDRAVWFVENSDWHAQLSLDVTDLYIRYMKSGPGNLEKDVERRFSYALSREDIENAILGGP